MVSYRHRQRLNRHREQQPTLVLARDLPLILRKVQPLLGTWEALLSWQQRTGQEPFGPLLSWGVCALKGDAL